MDEKNKYGNHDKSSPRLNKFKGSVLMTEVMDELFDSTKEEAAFVIKDEKEAVDVTESQELIHPLCEIKEEIQTVAVPPVKINCEDVVLKLEDIEDYDSAVETVEREKTTNKQRKKSPKKRKHSCDQCDYIATRSDHLKRHKLSIHKDRDCSEGVYVSPIQYHRRTDTEDEEGNDNNEDNMNGSPTKKRRRQRRRRFGCDQCAYSATRTDHLKRHVEAQHSGLRYACDICSYTTTRPARLKVHKSVVHEGNVYLCDKCTYSANDLGTLKRHKDVKHDGITYPCDRCEYVTSRLCYLKQHIESVHLKIRYPCDLCDYSATERSILRRHVKSKHEGVKYSCDRCNYQANNYSVLWTHKRTKHEGKKFTCNQCEYASCDHSSLRRHKQTKHLGVRYACDLCDYSASASFSLKKHKQARHPTADEDDQLLAIAAINNPSSATAAIIAASSGGQLDISAKLSFHPQLATTTVTHHFLSTDSIGEITDSSVNCSGLDITAYFDRTAVAVIGQQHQQYDPQRASVPATALSFPEKRGKMCIKQAALEWSPAGGLSFHEEEERRPKLPLELMEPITTSLVERSAVYRGFETNMNV